MTGDHWWALALAGVVYLTLVVAAAEADGRAGAGVAIGLALLAATVFACHTVLRLHGLGLL